METKTKEVMDPIPSAVREGVEGILEDKYGSSVIMHHFSFVGGGCINNGGKLRTSVGEFFLKWNSAIRYPQMFRAEAQGLILLKNPEIIDVPEVIGFGEGREYQFLLLEFVESESRSHDFWETFGNQLATLHRSSQVQYGLRHDNYIGSLRQTNTLNSSWIDFFVTERLQAQLKIAIDSGQADVSLARRFEQLFSKLSDLLIEETPSLVHGDLWSGNFITNETGNPCIIDPAVYYGNREVDLAMTQLFGGFDDDFYAAYHNAYPLAKGYQKRFDLYNLYPLLVHVNLFGASYLVQVNRIVNSFVA